MASKGYCNCHSIKAEIKWELTEVLLILGKSNAEYPNN
jgi:hypothetical protein